MGWLLPSRSGRFFPKGVFIFLFLSPFLFEVVLSKIPESLHQKFKSLCHNKLLSYTRDHSRCGFSVSWLDSSARRRFAGLVGLNQKPSTQQKDSDDLLRTCILNGHGYITAKPNPVHQRLQRQYLAVHNLAILCSDHYRFI